MQTEPPLAPAHARRISVHFDADPAAAASARDALLALDDRVDPELMGDVRLLVSELVTNSVRHSSAPRRDRVEMDVWVDSSTIRVEVRDSGTGFEPQQRAPDRSTPGGWGLFLVQRLTDRWGVACNHMTRVWFEIDSAKLGGRARSV
jgi:anti-sigma regulatory factor (Ser/Thr protein kinase)